MVDIDTVLGGIRALTPELLGEVSAYIRQLAEQLAG